MFAPIADFSALGLVFGVGKVSSCRVSAPVASSVMKAIQMTCGRLDSNGTLGLGQLVKAVIGRWIFRIFLGGCLAW